jgi:hypothetical protein
VKNSPEKLRRHFAVHALVPASAATVFERLDNHARLASHMSTSSWKMGGGKMQLELDEQQGRSVGSHIRLAGRVFGLFLSVDEVVTERTAPVRKVWETSGEPRLLVVAQYRMGFDIAPRASGCQVNVFIDYELPGKGITRWLGLLLGPAYARWCTQRMLDEASSSSDPARP